MRNFFFLAGLCLLLLQCKGTKTAYSELILTDDQMVIYLDSARAARTIVRDEMEQFFEQINKLDMAIQMQRNFPEETPREEVLAVYKDYLRKDVTDFTSEEKEFISGICREMLSLCEQVNSEIFPDEMWLIKSHGQHYGTGAYYTRENGVVIPKQALAEKNETAFLGVMLHELFHIYSRLNPEKRKELYARIGFKKLGPVNYLKMNQALRERILLNPDGVDYAYAITLTGPEGEIEQAIPLIVANETKYTNDKKEFFSYIHFDLYPIESPLSRLIPVKSDNDGYSQAGMLRWPDFHRQIGDNTTYIIHPDEILADNFMHLMMSKRDADYLNSFSEEGKKLIADIEEILEK